MSKKCTLRLRTFRLGVAVALLCTSACAAAVTRHVNVSTGVDSGACDVALPCQTIAYTITQSVAGDVIRLAAGIYEERNLVIPFNLSFIGASSATTKIDAKGKGRIFSSAANVVTISRLTLKNGNAPTGNGGAIDFTGGQLYVIASRLLDNFAPGNGGAIAVGAGSTLTVSISTARRNTASTSGGAFSCANCAGIGLFSSLVTDNTAGAFGGAIYADSAVVSVNTRLNSLARNSADGGGAIYATGSVVHVTDSNVEENRADSLDGGAVYAGGGYLNVERSTFADNTASVGNGGAIAVFENGALTSANSTYSGNSAAQGGAISLLPNFGLGPTAVIGTATFFGNSCTFVGCAGHIGNGIPSTLELYNSILSGGAGTMCFAVAARGRNNLLDDNTCGAAANFNLGVVTGLDPVLALNGGPTRTHDISNVSNAIDAGRNPACLNPWTGAALVVDQRGQPRPVDFPGVAGGVRCDIGAIEKQ
jgi:predicted outer membrane repeat protein